MYTGQENTSADHKKYMQRRICMCGNSYAAQGLCRLVLSRLGFGYQLYEYLV